MVTYEFPPKSQSSQAPVATQPPVSLAMRVEQMLKWSLYGVVALLVAGYLAIQTNPGVVKYLAAVPGLGTPMQASSALTSCSSSSETGCCRHRAEACLSESQSDELAVESAAVPPAPPVPEQVPREASSL